MPRANGFSAEGLAVLSRLGKNNSKDWFHAHKEEYQSLAREPVARVVAEINSELEKFAPEYVTAKKDPLSRANRDTRFSRDKSPYRTDIAVVFPRRGLEKHQAAGFFMRLHPGGVELIAGTYMPGPGELRALRRYLATHHKEFRKLVTAPALTKAFGAIQGEQLVRVPAPYDADHPAADLLRLKQFYFRRELSVAVATSPRIVNEIVAVFRVATPFVTAVDAALGNK